MDDLLQKYNDYIRLKNCRAEYLLSNGMIIDFTYKEENFIHLLGLQYMAKSPQACLWDESPHFPLDFCIDWIYNICKNRKGLLKWEDQSQTMYK